MSNLDLLIETKKQVQWITINRPDVRNALNDKVLNGIRDGVQQAMDNPDIRAIVLTAAGNRAFCAGGDLKRGGGKVFDFNVSSLESPMISLFKLMETCNIPVIGRINGHVMAGGMGLLCACDMAITTDRALFGTPETKIGLFPMMILTYMLRIIPRRKLLEMCITAEPVKAQEALSLGLVNHVVPEEELDTKVNEMLDLIVTRSPTAIKMGKHAFHAMQDMSIHEAFDHAQMVIPLMSMTDDAKEGFASFNEKRAPDFPGS